MDQPLATFIINRLGITATDLEVLAWRDGRIVCRARTPIGDIVVKASEIRDEFEEEAIAMARLQAIGLPVSDVISIERGPPALLIASWANGNPITSTTDPDTLRKVGLILSRIHEQPAGPPFSGNESIAAWIEGWFGTVMRWWLAIDARSVELEAQCHQWLEAVKPVLAGRGGTMALFDGRPDHFLVDEGGNVRLIDVADLQPGDPAMDLAVLELDAPGILTHVLEGYAPVPSDREAITTLVPFYVFLRALSGAEWQHRMLGNDDATHLYLEVARRSLAQHVQRLDVIR